MATPAELLYIAGLLTGHPYSTESRFYDPEEGAADEYDCSGYMRVILELANAELGPSPWTSWSYAAWCYDAGLELSVEEAIATPGAFLFEGPNRGLAGYGPTGHIALSRGDGTTFETPAWGPWGHGSGIGSAYGRGWSGAAKIPGIDYGDGQLTAQDPVLEYGCDPGLWLAVAGWQVWLNAFLHDLTPLAVSGAFDQMTVMYVREMQKRLNLEVDGVIGPECWAARRFIEGLGAGPVTPAPEPVETAPPPPPVPPEPVPPAPEPGTPPEVIPAPEPPKPQDPPLVKRIAKAISAAVSVTATWAAVSLADGHVTQAEWKQLSAALVAGVVVYFVPNKAKQE